MAKKKAPHKPFLPILLAAGAAGALMLGVTMRKGSTPVAPSPKAPTLEQKISIILDGPQISYTTEEMDFPKISVDEMSAEAIATISEDPDWESDEEGNYVRKDPETTVKSVKESAGLDIAAVATDGTKTILARRTNGVDTYIVFDGNLKISQGTEMPKNFAGQKASNFSSVGILLTSPSDEVFPSGSTLTGVEKYLPFGGFGNSGKIKVFKDEAGHTIIAAGGNNFSLSGDGKFKLQNAPQRGNSKFNP